MSFVGQLELMSSTGLEDILSSTREFVGVPKLFNGKHSSDHDSVEGFRNDLPHNFLHILQL